eukprot:jgi/Tetstr1/439397/TSEL_027832.t1
MLDFERGWLGPWPGRALADARRNAERLSSELLAMRDKVKDAERKDYERAEEIKRLRRSLRERELMLMQREGNIHTWSTTARAVIRLRSMLHV